MVQDGKVTPRRRSEVGEGVQGGKVTPRRRSEVGEGVQGGKVTPRRRSEVGEAVVPVGMPEIVCNQLVDGVLAVTDSLLAISQVKALQTHKETLASLPCGDGKSGMKGLLYISGQDGVSGTEVEKLARGLDSEFREIKLSANNGRGLLEELMNSEDAIDRCLGALDALPSPAGVLIEQDTNDLHVAVVLCHIGTRAVMTPEQEEVARKKSGCKDSLCQEKASEYISKKTTRIKGLPSVNELVDGIYAGPQVTEDGFRDIFKTYGIKSVICLRPKAEIGKLGLGVFAREETIMKDFDMPYWNIPIYNGKPIKEQTESLKEFKDVVETAPKPILVHCISGFRARMVCEELGIVQKK